LARKARHFWALQTFTKHMNCKVIFTLVLMLEVFVFTGEIQIKKLLLHFLESARYSAF